MKRHFLNHEELIELLATPLGDQRTVTKWLVNEEREGKQRVAPKIGATFAWRRKISCNSMNRGWQGWAALYSTRKNLRDLRALRGEVFFIERTGFLLR